MKKLAGTLFLLVWGASLFGQQLLFNHYTVSDGLCSNTIWPINQDDQGFLWVGTKGGLNRFDGYNFRKFQHDPSDTSSIGENVIRVIRKDGNNFWIGTENGLFTFDVTKESFTRFRPSIASRINDVLLDENGNVWIASGRQGIFFYNKKTDELKSYAQYISDMDVRALQQDDQGRIWIGTYGQGVDVLDPRTNSIEHHQKDNNPGSLSSNFILTMFRSREGMIWIGTLSGGLNYWDQKRETFVSYQHRDGTNSLSDNIVRAINQREPGKLLLGTEKGLDILDIEENSFINYRNVINDPYTISDNAVWSIFVDSEKNIWAGTYFGGLNFVNMKRGKFSYFYPSQQENSLSGKAVSSFLEDGTGMWVGTEDGGLNYFDHKDHLFYRYPFKQGQEPLSYHNIHALFRNDDGKLWIGTFSGGLNIYDPVTGKVEHYRHDPQNPNSLSDNSVYSIYKDKSGTIWVGTVVGLNQYHPEDGSFTSPRDLVLSAAVIYRILEDSRGNLWVATHGHGLFMRKKGQNTWLQYRSQPESNSLSDDRIISLYEDSRDRLWIGTDGAGLIRYREDGSFQRYGEADDFPLKTIYSILEDDHGNLWMSSNQGILCFNPDTGRKILFRQWDHLQSQQFNFGAGMISQNGTMYFGGINGFNTFNPDSILNNYDNNDYSIYLTGFQLFNSDVPITGKKGVLSKVINYTSKLTLSHDQSMVSLEYAGIDYISPHALEYSYIMEGFDSKWNEVGQQRRATYTNLPPGEYTFLIRAKNTKGAMVEKTRGLAITILPPFYRTQLAYFIYCFLAIGAFLFIRSQMVKRARKKNTMELERMKRREEQAFYKRKIEFFTEMAHEIRTPLSLIIAPLEKLIISNRTNKDTRAQLEIMEKNSDRLLSLINHLLDFRRIESDNYHLKPELVEVVELVRMIHSRFHGIADKKNIKFSFITELDHLEALVDTEAFTKILSNLLINAFKFARKDVSIVISRTQNPNGSNGFVVTVQDDGIGIPQKDLEFIFHRFFKVKSGDHQYNNLGGTGIGLSLAKSLTELHGGELKVESNENTFTRFSVAIPVSTDIGERGLKIDMEPSSIIQLQEDAPCLLVVEDNRSLLVFLCDSFRENGFAVLGAANGRVAVELLKEHDIDVVITDVMMPEMDGMHLSRHIKSDLSLCQVPVVLLTARSDPEAEIEGLETGADAYIHKPFKMKHVLLVVNNLLKSRQLLKLKFSEQPLSEAHSLTYNSRDEKFMQQVIELIEENISNTDFSIESLSADIGLSRSGLHKKLKGITGVGPNEFIRLIRLKRAAKLLKQGNYNISEVGYMSGFSSPSYFSKCFHEQFKKTPKEFIAQEAE